MEINHEGHEVWHEGHEGNNRSETLDLRCRMQ